MADRYWVGGSGNWTDTGHWSTSSGGASGASAPSNVDNAIFDSASHNSDYTVTLNATVNCLNLTVSAPSSGNVTFAKSFNTLNIYGNMTLYSGAIFSAVFQGGGIEFESTSTGKTITTAGTVINRPVTFNGNGGGRTLQDDLTLGSIGGTGCNITHTRGTLDTNGHTVTCTNFLTNNSNTRTLTLGASTINCYTMDITTTTNLTLNAGTSTINFDGGVGGVGLTFYNVAKTGTTATSFHIRGGTFNNVNISPGASKSYNCAIRNDITVSGTLTLSSNSAVNRFLLTGSRNLPGDIQKTITAAAVTTSNVDIDGIIGAGAASRDLSAENSGDCGNNTGITFTTADDLYWVGNGGSRSDTAHWSVSSGGASGARIPLPQDNVFIDANSISSASQTITIDMRRIGKNIDFTGVANNPTVTHSNDIKLYGSLTYTTGLTLSADGAEIEFAGVGSATFTAAGRLTDQYISIQNALGTLTFMSDVVTTSNVYQQGGTLDFNDFDVTTDYFWSYDATLLKRGNGTLTITSSYPLDMDYGYDATIFLPEGSTMKLTYDALGDDIYLYTSELIYNNIRIATGDSTMNFEESTTFNNFHADAGVNMVYAGGIIMTASSITVGVGGGGGGGEQSHGYVG